MPPDQAGDPNNAPVVLSRDLYNLIVGGATIPVLIFLIWLAWVIINRLMSSEWRQERRNREIRRAIEAREELLEKSASEKAATEGEKQKPIP